MSRSSSRRVASALTCTRVEIPCETRNMKELEYLPAAFGLKRTWRGCGCGMLPWRAGTFPAICEKTKTAGSSVGPSAAAAAACWAARLEVESAGGGLDGMCVRLQDASTSDGLKRATWAYE